MQKKDVLTFSGCTHFRQRIVCSILSGRMIRIENIRANSDNPGVREFEANFLRLIEKLTNGCSIEIDETGTTILFKPGFIVGGTLTHDCGNAKSIGWFLEGIIPLAPFAKKNFDLTFNGITNDDNDISVDLIRTVTIPLLKKFGLDEGIELRVRKRGAPPNGGGMVNIKIPIARQLKNVDITTDGKIRRIRGIAYCTRVSPQVGNRLVDASKGALLPFQQDVFIYTDHYKGTESGLSPGFALALVAESTTGNALAAEGCAAGGITPEELGKKVADLLLQEVMKGGCIDTLNQSTVLLLMILGPESVSRVRLGKLSPYTVESLRHFRDFFGVTFKLEEDAETTTIIATCRGIGYKNISKRVY